MVGNAIPGAIIKEAVSMLISNFNASFILSSGTKDRQLYIVFKEKFSPPKNLKNQKKEMGRRSTNVPIVVCARNFYHVCMIVYVKIKLSNFILLTRSKGSLPKRNPELFLSFTK